MNRSSAILIGICGRFNFEHAAPHPAFGHLLPLKETGEGARRADEGATAQIQTNRFNPSTVSASSAGLSHRIREIRGNRMAIPLL
jgi:hypothetical protein